MDRVAVNSSNVETIGYDADSQTLEVEFKNGTVYQYFDVSERVYEELRNADSVGGYLAAQIKGSYRYSKV
jgi:hypothetical protein